MAKAKVINEIPPIPEGAQGWRRSLKRRGTVFHAHSIGQPICGSRLYLDRNESEAPNSVGDIRYWGICARCLKMAYAPKKS